MFSTSMMASSTTTPTAITKPASTIVLIVPPVQYSTRAAAISDNGIAVTLTSAVRHWNRKTLSTRTTRKQPSSSARLRLPRDSSMNEAGRNRVVSTAIPVRPGCSSLSASSTPRVTSSVLPHGSFSTISISPGPPLMTASPISCWWSSTTVATSASFRGGSPSRSSSGTWARSAGDVMGCTCLMVRLWLGVSSAPPVPIKAPGEYLSRPASRASDVEFMTFSSVTLLAASLAGSTWTWSI